MSFSFLVHPIVDVEWCLLWAICWHFEIIRNQSPGIDGSIHRVCGRSFVDFPESPQDLSQQQSFRLDGDDLPTREDQFLWETSCWIPESWRHDHHEQQHQHHGEGAGEASCILRLGLHWAPDKLLLLAILLFYFIDDFVLHCVFKRCCLTVSQFDGWANNHGECIIELKLSKHQV